MANTNPAHIVLTNARLSYTHLDQPYSQSSDSTPKYSAVVLVPKSDPANRAKIDAAIRAATDVIFCSLPTSSDTLLIFTV